ncbi:MAG: transcription elongation factor NusA [Crenarchaeota archaeon]|nr:transcription elongation factor NusA [Thermoproteota archaeon]
MKIPFCTFCVKTRVFCARCQQLLDSQQYDMTDVDVINALLNIKQRFEEQLKNVEYVKAYDAGDTIVVVLRGIRSVPRSTIKEMELALEQQLGKRVRLVEKSSNISELASQLAHPARILTVAISWLPDGTSEAVVKIPKWEARRLPLKPNEFAKILSMITGTNVRVEVARY